MVAKVEDVSRSSGWELKWRIGVEVEDGSRSGG